MGSSSAFQMGFNRGQESNAHNRERKEMLADEERQKKTADLYSQRQAWQAKPGQFKEGSDEWKAATAEAQKGIADIELQLKDIYHPVNAPGALQRDFQFIKSLITRRPYNPKTTLPVAPEAAVGIVPTDQITKVAEPGLEESSISLPGAPMTVPGTDIVGPPSPAQEIKTPKAPAFKTTQVVAPGTKKVVGPLPPLVQDTMAVPPNKVQGLHAPGNMPIWHNQGAEHEDGSVHTEFPTSFTDDRKDSPYYGKEILAPTVIDGKFMTPDGKMPPHNSPEMTKMTEEAKKRYERTGQHLGVFDTPGSADLYADQLVKRSGKKRPDSKAYEPTPKQRKLQEQVAQANKDADQLLKSAPSEAQKVLADARNQVAAQQAQIGEWMKDYDKDNPNASKQEREKYRQWITQNVGGFKSPPATKWVYKMGKINGQPTYIRYDEKDPQGTQQRANGTPLLEDEVFVPDATKIPPTIKYLKDSNQVWDQATGKQYNANDPSNPPEVQAMFRGHDAAQAAQQAYGIRLTKERGASYNESKTLSVINNKTHLTDIVQFSDVRAHPGLYSPAGPGAKQLGQINMFDDIARTSRATREAIDNLSPGEAFDETMRAKIAVAVQADDSSAFDSLMSSNLIGSLSEGQVKFLVAARQLTENAMAMRSILGAGQGSEDVRKAIKDTLPGLLDPSREVSLEKLDAFDKTLEQLHRAVPDIKLSPQNWTVKGGENQEDTSAVGGGGTPAHGKGTISLSKAKTVHPDWTDDQVIADLLKNGYGYTRP